MAQDAREARIVVSYRRDDSAAMTGRIVDRLLERYGARSVFMDVDNIPFGVDFRAHIQDALHATDVFLPIIGPRWAGGPPSGPGRLSSPDDPVRVEVETALANELPIIPVLVESAEMPPVDSLPASLAPLHYLNAATVATGRDFNVHVERLIQAIDSILVQRGRTPSHALEALSWARPRWARDGGEGLLLVLAAGVLALPLAAWIAVLSPPWPPEAAPITVLVCLLAMLLGRIWRASRGRRPRPMGLISAAALGLAVIGYGAGLTMYTYRAPHAGSLSAKGFECTRDALLVYKGQCPDLGPQQLVEAEFRADALWTPRSIAIVEFALAALWFGGFLLLSLLVSLAPSPARSSGS